MVARLLRFTLLAAVASLVVASAAGAATTTVYAGPSGTAGGVFGPRSTGADVDAFSLPKITIHQGDKVRWLFAGFHTVTFPKKGGGDVGFIVPDPAGAKYSGFSDAAGKAFWFNGVGALDLNPLGILPQGGKTENGSKLTGSGLSLNPAVAHKPYTLTFPRTGTFRYECVVHPGMEATVKVVKRGVALPSASKRKAALKLQLKKDAAAAKKAATLTPPANSVVAGNDSGRVVQLRFFPSRSTCRSAGQCSSRSRPSRRSTRSRSARRPT